MSSPGGRGEGTLWGLFYKDANPSRGPHLRPNQLPKATTLSHHTVGEVSACEFGEHKPSVPAVYVPCGPIVGEP